MSLYEKITAALLTGTLIAASAVAAVSVSAAEPEKVIFGDINGDGKVNSKDLTRLMKYVSGEKIDAYGADLNGDGKENAKDLTRLMKYIADPDSVEVPGTAVGSDSTPATESVAPPVTVPVTEPVTDHVTAPVTDPVTKPDTDPVTDPVTKPDTDPATEPETEPETSEPCDLSGVDLSEAFPDDLSALEKNECSDPFAVVSEALNKNSKLSQYSLGKQIVLRQSNGVYFLKDTSTAGMAADGNGTLEKYRTDGLVSVGDGTGNDRTDYRYAAYFEGGVLYAKDDRNIFYVKEKMPYYMESALAEYTLSQYQSEYELILAEQTAFNKKAEVYTDADGRTAVTAVFSADGLRAAGIDILDYIKDASENDDRLLTDTVVMGNISITYIIDPDGYLSDIRLFAEDFKITYKIDASNSKQLTLEYDNMLHFGRTDVKIPELPDQKDYFEYDPGYDIIDLLFLPDGKTKVDNYDELYEWACAVCGKETVDDIVGY